MGNYTAARESFLRRGQSISGGGPAPASPAGQPAGLQPQASMSQPGIDQLGKSMPNEATLILKALIQRLKQNPTTP